MLGGSVRLVTLRPAERHPRDAYARDTSWSEPSGRWGASPLLTDTAKPHVDQGMAEGEHDIFLI